MIFVVIEDCVYEVYVVFSIIHHTIKIKEYDFHSCILIPNQKTKVICIL